MAAFVPSAGYYRYLDLVEVRSAERYSCPDLGEGFGFALFYLRPVVATKAFAALMRRSCRDLEVRRALLFDCFVVRHSCRHLEEHLAGRDSCETLFTVVAL